MELTERFYDKNKVTGDAVEQYHIILRMLETDEELITFNKKLTDAQERIAKREQKEKQAELKRIKKETDFIYREYQKMVSSLNREIGQMKRDLYSMTKSLKIKYRIKL